MLLLRVVFGLGMLHLCTCHTALRSSGYSKNVALLSEQCLPGWFYYADAIHKGGCFRCPAGKYGKQAMTGEGGRICEACPKGKWQKEYAAQSCFKVSEAVVECRLSLWSEWSGCDRTCGGGRRQRSRSILKHATEGGKSCGEFQKMESSKQLCNVEECTVPHTYQQPKVKVRSGLAVKSSSSYSPLSGWASGFDWRYPSHCMDSNINGDETDLNCGGSCARCGPSKHCLKNVDCDKRLMCRYGFCTLNYFTMFAHYPALSLC
jgi:hypothetical protein